MAPWFGSLGSGLGRCLGQVGGSVASFTGHISNVTEPVLRKGDEQGSEDVPESTSKEDEDSQSVLKSGNERLKPSVRKESDTVRDKEKLTVLSQKESNNMMLALKQKQMESCALQSEGPQNSI